ncbi:MAG: lamin tail domain-containing protein [Chloroflexales bacterium]|nr:lamin tail domain-containing protein [Chloroflexales bacterium]
MASETQPPVTPTPVTPTPVTPTPTSIAIQQIEYDPPGDDVAGEFVLIKNTGSDAADMTGWRLSDEANNTYTFPSFTLAAGAEVRVWTRAGTDDAGNLYWGRTQAVWNNTGDTAILRDAGGTEVTRYSY